MSNEPSLSDRAYGHLLQAIMGKQLRPGDIVDRRALAEELGISVSPVVNALTRLEQEGFLEIFPRRITRVRVVRPADFRAQLLLRDALECQAARVYCGQPVRDREKSLLSLAEEVDVTRDGRKINWTAEIAFHRALVELVENPGFLREFERVMRLGQYVLVSTFNAESPFPLDPSRSWHRDLVRDLQTDDPDEAERAVRAHVEAGRGLYLRPGRTS